MPIAFDFSELRGRIVAKYGTCLAFAEPMRMSRSQISDRLNHKRNFQPDEIYLACDLLDIPPAEIGRYFFTPKV